MESNLISGYFGGLLIAGFTSLSLVASNVFFLAAGVALVVLGAVTIYRKMQAATIILGWG